MITSDTIHATVLSSTVIRVPSAVHAASAPFTLILVEADRGRRLLGHFDGPRSPAIGSRVISKGRTDGGTLLFTIG